MLIFYIYIWQCYYICSHPNARQTFTLRATPIYNYLMLCQVDLNCTWSTLSSMSTLHTFCLVIIYVFVKKIFIVLHVHKLCVHMWLHSASGATLPIEDNSNLCHISTTQYDNIIPCFALGIAVQLSLVIYCELFKTWP